jgi:hypothetical protein
MVLMTKKKIFFAVALIITCVVCFISSCSKPPVSQPLEPISIVSPDSPIVRLFGGNTMPIEIKFTTDRPIDSILGLIDVDTLINATNYVPTYPDTLFVKDLTTLSPRQNLYDIKTSYTVPDSLPPFSVVRFKIWFKAGSNNFLTGQNYPMGVVTDSKEFFFNIR